MALTLNALTMLAPYLRSARILSLGYPDILATAEEIKELFGVAPTRFTNKGRWHGIEEPIPETVELFEKLNSSFECVDIYQETGLEIVKDLNYPHDLGEFDLVIDSGTIEHCFNIGQAILNAANAVKQGGRILHTPPMTMLNHGFYNICPTLLHDFYGQNEWVIEDMKAIGRDGEVKYERVKRFGAPLEVSLYCLAWRPHTAKLKFPTQHKYLVKNA